MMKEELILVYEGDFRARLYQQLVKCPRKRLYNIIVFPGRNILHLLPCAVNGSLNVKNENQIGSPAEFSCQKLLVVYV